MEILLMFFYAYEIVPAFEVFEENAKKINCMKKNCTAESFLFFCRRWHQMELKKLIE